jgi:peptide/nickel transport system permease protein
VLRSLIYSLLTLWLAATLTFVALRALPGDAIRAQYSEQGDALVQMRRAELGLDAPIWMQYGAFWVNLSRGDLGDSLYSRRPVSEILLEKLPNTLELTVWSMGLAAFIGVAGGVLAGLQVGWLTRLAHLLIGLSISVPIYWTGTFVLFVIGIRIGGTQGKVLLPALVLGFHAAGAVARLLQTHIREVSHADFVRTAHGKGLPETVIMRRHILRLGLLPVLTVLALQAGFIFSGAVITESIFQRAGIGMLLLDAVLNADYPVVQGVTLLTVTIYILLNGLAEFCTHLIDPRLRV